MAAPLEASIHLVLAENVTQGLAIIISRLAGAQGAVRGLEAALTSMGRAGTLAVAGLAAFGGYELIKGIVRFTDRAKELSHELTQIQKLGLTMPQFDAAKAAALEPSTPAVPPPAPGHRPGRVLAERAFQAQPDAHIDDLAGEN